MREEGILLGTDGPHHNVVKIRPPMPFDSADADRLVETFTRIVTQEFPSPAHSIMSSDSRRSDGYDRLFAAFDSPLMRELRREAYGVDIGQHSWVTVEDLRADLARLGLAAGSRLLDMGCGAGGPLVFVVEATGCEGTGVDASPPALAAAGARADAAGVGARVRLREADLNAPLPFDDAAFDAVIAFDVMLHVRDRQALIAEVARVLAPAGRFLYTDAGVMTGPITNEEIKHRSTYGYTQLVPPGFNERLLESARLALVASEDRTASLLRNARGRLRARGAHRAAVEEMEGSDGYARQQEYLETVVTLSERGALARMMYLAVAASPRGGE